MPEKTWGSTIDPNTLTTDDRKGWKQTINQEEAIINTLKMVIESIKQD